MDTRSKIIEPEGAVAVVAGLRDTGTPVKVVTGYFDVVTADHVRRLREIKNGGRALLVVVLDPPAPLLNSRARAEILAAFRMVDYVVPAGDQAARDLLTHFTPAEIVREEPADLLRARHLCEHVQRRQQQ